MYAWPSRTPTTLVGSSRPILGSASVTTLPSRKTIPDPMMTAIRIQRPAVLSAFAVNPTSPSPPIFVVGPTPHKPRRRRTCRTDGGPAAPVASAAMDGRDLDLALTTATDAARAAGR